MTLVKQSCDDFIGAAQYVLHQRNNYEVRTHKTNFFYKISLQNLSLLDNEQKYVKTKQIKMRETLKIKLDKYSS